MIEPDPVVFIVGAGPQLGAALGRRFAKEGFVVAMARRDAARLEPLVEDISRHGGRAVALPLDATREADVAAAVERLESDVGPIEAAIFNAGTFRRMSILDLPAEDYRAMWEVNAFAGFLVAREAARRMVPRGRGTILLTGATAALRGGDGFAGFAGGKFALRALAQSMARELGPKGIHVAHVVIDGLIEGETTRGRMGEHLAKLPPDGALAPDGIAEAYLQLHRQHRSAWTQELDLRPWSERF